MTKEIQSFGSTSCRSKENIGNAQSQASDWGKPLGKYLSRAPSRLRLVILSGCSCLA